MTLIIIDEGFCNPDETETRYGTYVWPETEIGETVQMNCVFGSVLDGASVSRQCVGINQWMDGINPGQCFSEVTLEIQAIGVSVSSASTCRNCMFGYVVYAKFTVNMHILMHF